MMPVQAVVFWVALFHVFKLADSQGIPSLSLAGAQTATTSWAWSRVQPTGTPPAGREGHAAVEVGSRIYVIGGCIQEIQCLNDVHVFDTDTLAWTQESITGDAPEPRGGHSAVLMGTNIYVFGGASSEATYGDAYKLDLVKRHWSRAVPTDGDAMPSRRTNHAAAADSHGRIYIFGGYSAESNFLNDMWILNVYAADAAKWDDEGFPVVWEKPVPTGPIPQARESHSLTLVDRKLVLFGGYAACGKAVNDVHVYDIDAQEWSIPLINGLSPPPRQAHAAARHGQDVVIAGGCDVSGQQPICYNDVWSLSMIEMQWKPRSSDAVTWFSREGHSATFVRGRLFTFGGCKLSLECYNDVTVLDTLDPCPSSCGGHGECISHQFCRCEPGFTGHDCMQPLTCPMDCSNHGTCSQNGQCLCENGWTGPQCSQELPCPGSPYKCSMHGTCTINGACQCFAGYSGVDCSAGQAVCPQACSGHGVCGMDSQCKCNNGWSGVACSISVHALVEEASTVKSLSSEKALTAKPLATEKAQCKEACCGHGKCSSGECHCDTGWHGPSCAVNQSAWKSLDTSRHARQVRLKQVAEDKRTQAETSKVLAEAISNALKTQTGDVGSMLRQMFQLEKDTKSLFAEADIADKQALELFEAGSKEDLAFLESIAMSCHVKAPDGANANLLAVGVKQIQADSWGKDVVLIDRKNQENGLYGVSSVNAAGHTGPLKGSCEDNCNFRGVCREEDEEHVCYCQPGYYGDTCNVVYLSSKKSGTMTLISVLATGVICLLLSFLFAMAVLFAQAQRKKSREAKLGYRESF